VLLETLGAAGAEVTAGEGWVRCRGRRRPLAVDVTTLPFPGFPTDLQAQMMACLTVADGISVVTERIFPDRFMHVAELLRLGAGIRKEGAQAVVVGTPRLSGATVMASDLRASAALVLAGLVAEGTTEVRRVYHIDRGYERIDERLASLGATIVRERQPKEAPEGAPGEGDGDGAEAEEAARVAAPGPAGRAVAPGGTPSRRAGAGPAEEALGQAG
jgi:UDP-N-acetylglucosamine 1-carboxyvinyltransferase